MYSMWSAAVSGQQLGKHVPVATDTNGRKEELCFLWSGKRQTSPLVRENAPHEQDCNCLTVIKIWS
jgi:hypothetical protein